MAEKFFSGTSSGDKSLIQVLQSTLENTRIIQHRIFHFMMANQESRDPCLNYIAQVLKYNEKRYVNYIKKYFLIYVSSLTETILIR